jgi:hypothetical protein
MKRTVWTLWHGEARTLSMLRNLSTRRHLLGLAALGLGLALTACNDTASDFNPTAPPRARAPAGVPVSLVSLSGAPETITSRLSSALSTQAARRDITIVGVDGKPRYQVRGYLAAHALSDGKAELSWTFDIYDSQRRRAKRFAGDEPMRSGQDWSAVTDQQLQAIAFKALDEIAEFLAASPEAVAGGAAGRAAGLLASE